MINGNDLFICYLKNLGEDHVVDLMRRLRRYILFKTLDWKDEVNNWENI